jgi:sulfur carrier protein ThiS
LPPNSLHASPAAHDDFLTQLQETKTMKVLLINNDGGGFADYIEVAENLTVQELFNQRVGAGKEADYLIRVNRQPVARDQVLLDGDRISITATKIQGALS